MCGRNLHRPARSARNHRISKSCRSSLCMADMLARVACISPQAYALVPACSRPCPASGSRAFNRDRACDADYRCIGGNRHRAGARFCIQRPSCGAGGAARRIAWRRWRPKSRRRAALRRSSSPAILRSPIPATGLPRPWPRPASRSSTSSTMPASACSAERSKRDRAEQLEMIAVNIRALTDLSLRFSDHLIRHRGGLLNVGSIAGFLAGAGNGGLLCLQGLCAVVHRSDARRTGAAWRTGDGGMSRSGAVGVSGAGRI